MPGMDSPIAPWVKPVVPPLFQYVHTPEPSLNSMFRLFWFPSPGSMLRPYIRLVAAECCKNESVKSPL